MQNLSWTSGPPLSSSGNVTPVMLLSEENQLHFLFAEDQRSPGSSACRLGSHWGLAAGPASPQSCSTFGAAQGGSSPGGAVTPQHPWDQAAELCDAAVVRQKRGEAGLESHRRGDRRSHLFLWTPDSWAQLKIIVAVAHVQLTEILSFNLASVNAEYLCFIPKILGHRDTEHRFIMILFLEYLNCCWCDRLHWLKRTGITKQTQFDLRLDIFAKTKLYKI